MASEEGVQALAEPKENEDADQSAQGAEGDADGAQVVVRAGHALFKGFPVTDRVVGLRRTAARRVRRHSRSCRLRACRAGHRYGIGPRDQ
jgi:hypothetical protein